MEHNADLDKFLQASDDFVNVFTTIGLDDFRSIKDCKTDNIVHIVSHVSKILLSHIFLKRPSKSCMIVQPRLKCFQRKRTLPK